MYCIAYNIFEYSYSKVYLQAVHHILYISFLYNQSLLELQLPSDILSFILKSVTFSTFKKVLLTLMQILNRGVMTLYNFTDIT